mgnify:CR=1 FL=1
MATKNFKVNNFGLGFSGGYAFDFAGNETANFVDLNTARGQFSDTLSNPKIITYCGGAIAATVGAFTLLRLGHKNVSVYDASLMEWSADESLPMTDPQKTA